MVGAIISLLFGVACIGFVIFMKDYVDLTTSPEIGWINAGFIVAGVVLILVALNKFEQETGFLQSLLNKSAKSQSDKNKKYIALVDSKTNGLYTKAIKGDAEAQYVLGTYFSSGNVVQKDDKQAFYWFLKSAEKGHNFAMIKVGWHYDNGIGTKKRLQQSILLV